MEDYYDELLEKLISVLEFVDPDEKQKWFECKKCKNVGIHLFAHSCLHIICDGCYIDKQICPICKSDPSGIGVTKVTQMEDVKKVRVFCPLKTSDCEEISNILDIAEHVKSSHGEKIEELLAKPGNAAAVPIMETIPQSELEDVKQSLKDAEAALQIAQEDIIELKNQVGALEDTVQHERQERLKLQSEVQMLRTAESENGQQGAHPARSQQDFQSLHLDQSSYDEQNLENELKITTQSTQKDSTSYTWRLRDFPQILQDLKSRKCSEYSSAIFATCDHHFKMRANLCFHSPYEYISLFMGFISDPSVALPVFYHRRTVILEDQSGQARRNDITRVYEPGFGRKDAEMWMKGFYGWWMFAPIKLLFSDSRYVRNGTVVVKIVIEPLVSLYRSFSSNVGVLFWNIDNYKEAKEDEVDEVVDCSRSDYFYSSKTGYRMQLRAHLNGWKEGKGTYMALFLWFLKGQFDDTLTEKIHYRITCVVLDQTISFVKNDLAKTIERSDDRLDVGYGFPDFALQATIENDVYLRNNTLSIKVVVEILS